MLAEVTVKRTDRCGRIQQAVFSVVLGTILTALAICAFQSTVVYGILLYSGVDYWQTMSIELQHRSGSAYWACLEGSIEKQWTTITNFLALF